MENIISNLYHRLIACVCSEKSLVNDTKLIDSKSTLVGVMALCSQVRSHHLSRRRPRAGHHMAPLGHNDLIKIGKPLFSMGKDFNSLCHLSSIP